MRRTLTLTRDQATDSSYLVSAFAQAAADGLWLSAPVLLAITLAAIIAPLALGGWSFSGEALMSVWSGIENGIASADVSPEELAPTNQQQLHWPKFGQHYETSGKAGEAPDMPEGCLINRR